MKYRVSTMQLVEGALEKEATAITRYLVPELKKLLKTVQDASKDPANAKYLSFADHVDIDDPAVLAKLLPPGNPIQVIRLKLDYHPNPASTSKSDLDKWGVGSSGSYGHLVNKDTGTKVRAMILDLLMTSNMQLSQVIPNLKQTIRHELEHSVQGDDALGKRKYVSAEKSMLKYLSQPIEVEAWVAGMYKEAKIRKIPLIDLMRHKLANAATPSMWSRVPRLTKASQEKIMKLWLAYAKKRFPKAQLGDAA